MEGDWISCDLLNFEYRPLEGVADFLLLKYPEEVSTLIECFEVLLFKVSNTPGDMQPTFVVDVSHKVLSFIEGLECMRRAGYDWLQISELNEIHYFHFEGDVVIDVFSASKCIKEVDWKIVMQDKRGKRI